MTEAISLDPGEGPSPANRRGARTAAAAAPRLNRSPPRLSGANRYSFFVGVMKVLLPAMAAAMVLLVIVWPRIESRDERFRVGISELLPEQITNSAMVNPRFEGIDESGQPFSVTADIATQAAEGDDRIMLEMPKGDIFLDDSSWVAVTAKAGRYYRDRELLDLLGDVNLFHDKGYELRTEAARVDLEAGTAVGTQPVSGQGPFGFIDSEGFRVELRGDVVFFTGQTHMMIYTDNAEILP